ncbi:MAG: GNAT family N-acetyltransferase [Magnetococcales bacterium]|nr:GNAT family N-acetyltransferase [Magnetococcales bacterium]
MNEPLCQILDIKIDDHVVRDDMERVRVLVTQCGNFTPDEVDMAVELVEARLGQGDKSGYFFLFARLPSGRLAGYSCYGPIAATDGRFDFYWLAVTPEYQGSGLASRIQVATEEVMVGIGAKRSYLETSSTPPYEAARRFYTKVGYRMDGINRDFYRKGDDRCVFVKALVEE